MKKSKRKRLKNEERLLVYEKCKGHCAYCGCEIEFSKMQVDHVHSIYTGGSDELENMLPSCRSCNHYKSTMTIEDFRKALTRMPDVLLRDCTTYRIAERFGIVKSNSDPVLFYFELHNINQK